MTAVVCSTVVEDHWYLGINPTVGPGTSYDDMNSGKIAWDSFQGGVQFHWQTGDSSVLPCIA